MNYTRLRLYLQETAQAALNEYALVKDVPVGSFHYGATSDRTNQFDAPFPQIHSDRLRDIPKERSTTYYFTVGFFAKSDLNLSPDEMTVLQEQMVDLSTRFMRIFNQTDLLSDITLTGPREFLRSHMQGVMAGEVLQFTAEGDLEC